MAEPSWGQYDKAFKAIYDAIRSRFEDSDLLWADGTFSTAGDSELIPAPGPGKKIAIYFYRKGNLGDGENTVAFKWQDADSTFFKSKMWYCGLEAANLVIPRVGPENKGLLVNLSLSNYPIDISVGYKIVSV